MRWYAVYTQAHLEFWARANLWERGFEVYLPQFRKTVRHARRTREIVVPLFSRYLFVRAELELGHRRQVDTAQGVTGMVSFGDASPPIADRVMDEIKGREGPDGMIAFDPKPRFNPGDRIRLSRGPFADHAGLFESTTDAERVVVLLTLLGRETRVKVAADLVALDR